MLIILSSPHYSDTQCYYSIPGRICADWLSWAKMTDEAHLPSWLVSEAEQLDEDLRVWPFKNVVFVLLYLVI